MGLLDNMKQLVKERSLSSNERELIDKKNRDERAISYTLGTIDIDEELKMLDCSFNNIKYLNDNENGTSLVLGDLGFSEIAFISAILKRANEDYIGIVPNYYISNFDYHYSNLSNKSYNIVLSSIKSDVKQKYNNFEMRLLNPVSYYKYKEEYNLVDISIFANELNIYRETLRYFVAAMIIYDRYNRGFFNMEELEKAIKASGIVNNSTKEVTNEYILKKIRSIKGLINNIITLNKSLNEISSNITRVADTFKQCDAFELANNISINTKRLRNAVSESKNTCVVVTKFKSDVLQNLLDDANSISDAYLSRIGIKQINSLYIDENFKNVATPNKDWDKLLLVIQSPDLIKNNIDLNIITTKEILELKEANVNIIELGNTSYDRYNIAMYINLMYKALSLSPVSEINTSDAYLIMNFNNKITKITKDIKVISKGSSSIQSIDINNSKQTKFEDKVENIKNIANNTINNNINIKGHDDRELAKRLMSLHTNITKILEYSLKLDIKCHNYRFIENEIIAFPLVKVNHRLLKEIIYDNREVLYLGKDGGGNRILKTTGIPIINNYMYKNINDSIKEKFEHTKLLCPLVVQNYFNSKIYNTVEANLFLDIQNNKFNNFFILMLVVYRGNILLQLWDRDYLIKQLKKENVKFIKYVENSSTGLPYIDNIKGNLVDAIGLNSNSSTDNSELKYISGLVSLFKVITNNSDYEYLLKDYEESLELVRNAYDKNIRLLNKQIYSKDTDKTYLKFVNILNDDELYSRCYKLLSALSAEVIHTN